MWPTIDASILVFIAFVVQEEIRLRSQVQFRPSIAIQ